MSKSSWLIVFLCFFLAACTRQTNIISSMDISEVRSHNDSLDMLVNDSFDKMPLPRAMVAKMLCLLFLSIDEINAYERYIEFKDTSPDVWYDKYINAAYINGFMSGIDNESFAPMSFISIGQVQFILDNLMEDNKIKIQMDNIDKNAPVSYALWISFYQKLIESVSDNELKQKDIVILSTSTSSKVLPMYNLISNEGNFRYTGMNLDFYIDKEINILEKNGEIVAILELKTNSPWLKRAIVSSVDDGTCTVFIGGVTRRFKCSGDVQNAVADVLIHNGKVLEIVLYDKFIDEIKKVGDDEVFFELRGAMAINNAFKVYEIGERISLESIYALIPGEDNIEFYYNDYNELVAAVIVAKVEIDSVRVAINNSDFSSIEHSVVDVTSDQDFFLKKGGEQIQYKKDEVASIKADFTDIVQIMPSQGGKLKILSILRKGVSPEYRGCLEILRSGEKMNIINELPLEEYLYSVVSSEMPSSYDIRALKAQAVAARTYTYSIIYDNLLHSYGANLDDSVSTQVYNNIAETKESIKAVQDTKSQILTFNGEPIEANFFSSSSGMTANNNEVWADIEGGFSLDSRPYLTVNYQYKNSVNKNLSKEQDMEHFIKDAPSAYDDSSPWYRWSVIFTKEELGAIINANLSSRYRANPKLIKTLTEGVFESRDVDNIGEVKNIDVIKRGEAGNIMIMQIEGEKEIIQVSAELNIRLLISPTQKLEGNEAIKLYLNDGTQLLNNSIMPSAFYIIEKTKEGDFKFMGGGNGHGVGMSQNGAQGMASLGFDYDDILMHYYPGSVLSKV